MKSIFYPIENTQFIVYRFVLYLLFDLETQKVVYVGHTINAPLRIRTHNLERAAAGKNPVKMILVDGFDTKRAALTHEKNKIKEYLNNGEILENSAIYLPGAFNTVTPSVKFYIEQNNLTLNDLKEEYRNGNLDVMKKIKAFYRIHNKKRSTKNKREHFDKLIAGFIREKKTFDVEN